MPKNNQLAKDAAVLGVSFILAAYLIKMLLGMLDPHAEKNKKNKQLKDEVMRRLQLKITTTSHEDAIAAQAVNPDDITTTFSDIGGHDALKRSLEELVILPFLKPELFYRGRLLRPPKGVLLYGPPGTGKTMLAKAIAKETRAVFINITMSTVMDQWFGESQKLIRAIFTLANKLQPCIIFLDEIDAFLRKRSSTDHDAMSNMKSEFMSLWDGLSTDETARVIVIGATNRPWDVDKAILRRMPRSFLVDLPERAQREAILRTLLKDESLQPDFDFSALAGLTQRYSGSDLAELARAACMQPVIEHIRRAGYDAALDSTCASDLRPLSVEDFERAKEDVPPTGENAEAYFARSCGMSLADVTRSLRAVK